MADEDLPRAIVGIELSMNATGWETQRPRLIGDADYAGGVIGPEFDYAGGVMRPRSCHDFERVVNIIERLARQINDLPQSLAPLACVSPRRPRGLDTTRREAILEGVILHWLQQRRMPTVIVEPPLLDRWLAGGAGQKLTGNNLRCLIWRRYRIEVEEFPQARAAGLAMIGAVIIGERQPAGPNEEKIVAQLRKTHPDVCRVCGVKL